MGHGDLDGGVDFVGGGGDGDRGEGMFNHSFSLSLFIVVEDLDDIGKRRKEEGQQEEDSEPEERNGHTHFKVKIIHIQRQFLRNHL